MIIIDIKVNNTKICSLHGIRYPGAPADGRNAYNIQMIDAGGNYIKRDITTHDYKDGILMLVSRIAGRFHDIALLELLAAEEKERNKGKPKPKKIPR